MNLGELTDQIRAGYHEPSYFDFITTWLNESVRELAFQYDLPGLRLKLPASLTTTTTDWQYLISTATPPATSHSYMKRVFKITNSAHERGIDPINRDIQVINDLDPDHDETGDDVDRVAVEDETDDATIAIYPKANDTLSIWYYRNPVDMSANGDTPDGIPAAFHLRVLMPMVILRAFREYPNLAQESVADNTRALTYWQGKLNQGLFGDGFQIGMVDAIRQNRKPRIQPAPIGSNLSGSDRVNRRGFR